MQACIRIKAIAKEIETTRLIVKSAAIFIRRCLGSASAAI